ncbi:MAG TPA: MarP family serine protease [Actinomycetota bacterium]|nr:MarP family serine protease [Actinomycetota bacterium]
MNLVDLVLLAGLVLAAFSGYRRGLALQSLSFGGLLVGLAVGAVIAPWIADVVESPLAQATVATGVLIGFAAIGDAIGWMFGSRLRTRARATRFKSADAAGGSMVAVAASLLAIWFVALNLVNGPFPDVSRQIRGSAIVRTLDDTLPPPPSLLSQVRRFFNRFGFPDVFSGIPPLPAEPVREPSKAETRAVFALARDSTVRIVGEACGQVQEGSGFVAADGYVVTNAHVVAGVTSPFVQTTTTTESAEARTVVFDPDLDIAILHLATSPGPVLALSVTDVERGDRGAVLGYPGGGPLTGGRAAVLRTWDGIEGRDIYGEGDPARDIIEIQATVRPGNSGGPFVLPDGTVAGVVFAASTTEEAVGYAISANEIAPRIDQAVGETAPVDTGDCLD